MMRRILLLPLLLLVSFFTLQAQAQKVRVDQVILSGNVITKDFVILRDLPFAVGDSLQIDLVPETLQKAKENLANMSLFTFVNMDSYNLPESQDLIVIISVEERWYIWPVVEVRLEERNLSTWLQDLDFKRITYEAGIRIENFLGLKHKLIITGHGGYQWGAFLGYRDVALSRDGNHFIGINVQANTSHNIDAFTGADRPARFNISDKQLERSLKGNFNYTYRPSIRETHKLQLAYELTAIDDTVLTLNPNYWGTDDLQRSALRLNYNYCLDQRDYHYYPLSGYYIRGGLNTYLSTDTEVRYGQLTLGLQYFKHLGGRWYASTAFNGAVSLCNTQAYILNHAIGYGNAMLRGYEYTVADGQSFAVSNNTLKYNILPKKTFNINWLSWLPKFNKIPLAIYANLHFDMGYAHNKWDYKQPHLNGDLVGTTHNTLSNKFLYAGGVGIDVVTYYDLAFGIDYSYNNNIRGERGGFYFTIRVPFL